MNPTKFFKRKNSFIIILLFFGIALFACNSDNSGTPIPYVSDSGSEDNAEIIMSEDETEESVVVNDTTPATQVPETPQSGGEDFNFADVVSSATPSATPGGFSRPLDDSHEGWQQSTCLTEGCHPVNHNARYTESNCASCHGFNGAANIPADHNLSHDDEGSHAECADAGCHADSHAGQSFQSPVDCKACHRLAQTETPSFTEEYDVVVIGAGGGGLSTAAILAKAGLKVLIIEKHYKVGGMFGNFYRGDYNFEIGLHGEVLREMSMVLGMLGKVGVIEEEMCGPIFMRSVYPDKTIDIPSDPWKYEKLLKEIYPEDEEEITRLFDSLMFFAGVFPYFFDDSQHYFDQFTDNVEIVHILTQMALYMNEPLSNLAVPLMMFMFNGYNVGGFTYPIGTTQKVANTFAEIVTEEGGRVELNTLATKINIEDDTATEVWTNHGGRYKARHIVSNSNAEYTFLTMVGEEHLPENLITAIKGDENGEGKLKIAQSSINIYLGLDKDYTDCFPEGSHEISLCPSYDPHDHYDSVVNCAIENTRFAIANYSVVDPGAAPEGKNVLSLCGQLDYDCPDGQQWFMGDYEQYDAYKNLIATNYINRTAELPGMEDIWDHIEVIEVCSPHTVEGYTFSTRGTLLGYGFGNDQLFNATRTYGVGTPIKNLYLTGQWSSGGGQPLVILGGMLTSSAIIACDPGAADIVDFMIEGFSDTMQTYYWVYKTYILGLD